MTEADQRFGIKGSVGIGIPDMPEIEGDTLYAVDVPTTNGKPLRVDLSARLDRDVRLDNDANCFALSEARDGEFTQYPLVMGLILSTGIGGDLMLNERSITGRSYITGEFGHIRLPVDASTLMDFDFPLRHCGCGQLGCIESYLLGGEFAWLYQHCHHQPLGVREIITLWKQGDEHARAHVKCYLDLLAVRFGNILTTTDPGSVVISGGLLNFTAIMTQLADRPSCHLLPVARVPRIERTRHDDTGRVRGATFLHLTDQYKEVVILSRRGYRLSRLRKNKRHLCDRLRRRIFLRDRVMPEPMEKSRVLVLTGAGIPAESGIRTFRATDGLWEKHRIGDVATPEGSNRNPELVQPFYNIRRHQLQQSEIQPSAARIALVKPEAEPGDRFLPVTQNIDNLHEHAGSQSVIHMHGGLLKVRCSQGGQTLERAGDVTPEDKCHCYQFPASLRPHVVWFGETPLGMDEVYTALAMVDVFIAIDTLGRAYPVTGFMHEARLYGAHTVELNLGPSQVGSESEERYYNPASQTMPEFIEKLLEGL